MFWKPKWKEDEGGFGKNEIRTWAEDPKNQDRAKALGLRLFTFANDAKSLLEQESLGEFEDQATRWAIDHQAEAKLLMIELAAKLVKPAVKPTVTEPSSDVRIGNEPPRKGPSR